MATVKGANRTKKDAVPSQKIPPGEVSGRRLVAYDEYTPVADIIALNDIIDLALDIPKGARILEATLICPSMGTTGKFALGTSGDPDALIADADAGGQAVKGQSPLGSADLGKELSADTSYQIKVTEATDAALGDKIQVWIDYVLN